MTTIFYHSSDFDGICSAAIAYNTCIEDARLIGVDYNDEISFDDIEQDSKVFILDFSFRPEMMEKLIEKTTNIIWLDHHKTAMEYVYSIIPMGIRKIGMSGCELTWLYLYPDAQMPLLVHMLGRYDVWDFTEYNRDDLEALQYGLRHTAPSPDAKIWNTWFEQEASISGILAKGKILKEYTEKEDSKTAINNSYRIILDGYTVVCLNTASRPNAALKAVITSDDDIGIIYSYVNGQWKVSLRTMDNKDVDVSLIAKKYGGGGHKTAAAFFIKDLPLEFLSK